jgi:hypothetical protein
MAIINGSLPVSMIRVGTVKRRNPSRVSLAARPVHAAPTSRSRNKQPDDNDRVSCDLLPVDGYAERPICNAPQS